MRLILLLLYIAVSYVYPGELIPALAPYRITYWVGVTGLAASALWLIRKKAAPLRTSQLWLLVAFAITLGASRMLADRWLGAPVMAVQRFGPSLAMFILTVCSVDSLRKLRIVTAAIVLLSLILVVQGFAAYHFGYKQTTFLYDPSTRGDSASVGADEPDEAGNLLPAESSESADDDDAESDLVVRIRGLGVLHDPNDLAAGLVMALALLGAGWVPGARLRNVLLVVVPGIAFGYGVFLTHSRGGTLALVVTLAGTFARRLKRQTTILVMIGLLAGVVAMDFSGGRKLLSPADESASERITAWTEGLEMLKSSPVLGIGYGQFFEHHTLTAHNSLVLCFAETGIVGYFFWLGLLVITFGQLHGLSSIAGEEPVDAALRKWAATLQLALLGFMTAAFFLSRTYVPMLYLVVGLSVALILIARQQNRPVWSPAVPRLGVIVLGSEAASMLLIYIVVKLRLM